MKITISTLLMLFSVSAFATPVSVAPTPGTPPESIAPTPATNPPTSVAPTPLSGFPQSIAPTPLSPPEVPTTFQISAGKTFKILNVNGSHDKIIVKVVGKKKEAHSYVVTIIPIN